MADIRCMQHLSGYCFSNSVFLSGYAWQLLDKPTNGFANIKPVLCIVYPPQQVCECGHEVLTERHPHEETFTTKMRVKSILLTDFDQSSWLGWRTRAPQWLTHCLPAKKIVNLTSKGRFYEIVLTAPSITYQDSVRLALTDKLAELQAFFKSGPAGNLTDQRLERWRRRYQIEIDCLKEHFKKIFGKDYGA